MAVGLLPHKRIQGDVPKRVMTGEPPVMPLYCVLEVVLIWDVPLARLNEIG